jgi:branched-chain amino acid transport system substrate-binding protein
MSSQSRPTSPPSPRRRPAWFVLAACAAALATLAAACSSSGSTSPASSSAPAAASPSGGASSKSADSSLPAVHIAFTNTDQGTTGQPTLTSGAKAAVAYANADLGGIDGHPIVLDYCSAGADAQTNQACGQQFANDKTDKVVLTGLMFNGGPLYAALKPSGIPIVGFAPITQADFDSPAYFWTAGQLSEGGYIQLARAVAPGLKTVGAVGYDDAVGEASLAFTKTFAGSIDIKSVAVSTSAADLLGPISSMGKVGAYLLSLSGTACIQAAEAIKQFAPTTPVVSANSCTSPDITSQAGTAMAGWYFPSLTKVTNAAGADSDADVKTFNDNYLHFGGTSTLEDSPYTSGQWGVTLTVIKILSGLGYANLTQAKVAAALKAFTGPVILGPPTIACPGTAPYPSACAREVFGYKLNSSLDPQLLTGSLAVVPVSPTS